MTALTFLANRLSAAATLSETTSVATACLGTILNGIDAINASRIAEAWKQEALNLQAIQALPISLPSSALTVLNARTATMIAAAAQMAALVPSVGSFMPIGTTLPTEAAAIPDVGLLEFYEAFNVETAPAGLMIATMIAQGQSIVTAFNTIANTIIAYQGAALTRVYDTSTRLARVSQAPVDMLNNYTSGSLASSLDPTLFWNQLVVLPALLTDANLFNSAPYSLAGQQSCVIRYSLITMAQQIALFLIILRSPAAAQVTLATVNNGDTLMDIAARSMGDFEQWQSIADLNGLQPPWITEQGGTGVAAWGDKLLIPTPGSAVSPSGAKPSYDTNFLGVDLYLGPINQPMLAWNGDFQVIAGLRNLAISLGRRLQTTLGTLLYHSDFGSKIPPEVGNVQTQDTSGHITAFGRAALLSDPRVGKILSAQTTLLPNFAVAFQGSVQPAGSGAPPVAVNEVLAPTA